MKTAFLFPGQGSQKVGMVQDLFENYDSVKALIKEADETLGFSISKMMFEGPDTELMKTEFTQPAILTASRCMAGAEGTRPHAGYRSRPQPWRILCAGRSGCDLLRRCRAHRSSAWPLHAGSGAARRRRHGSCHRFHPGNHRESLRRSLHRRPSGSGS